MWKENVGQAAVPTHRWCKACAATRSRQGGELYENFARSKGAAATQGPTLWQTDDNAFVSGTAPACTVSNNIVDSARILWRCPPQPTIELKDSVPKSEPFVASHSPPKPKHSSQSSRGNFVWRSVSTWIWRSLH